MKGIIDNTEQEMCKVYDAYYNKGYEQGRADVIEEFRTYLKTVVPCEMPQDIWNIGVDNTCDSMLKEQK